MSNRMVVTIKSWDPDEDDYSIVRVSDEDVYAVARALQAVNHPRLCEFLANVVVFLSDWESLVSFHEDRTGIALRSFVESAREIASAWAEHDKRMKQ